MLMEPSAPIFATTMFGTVWPAVKFRLDALGGVSPLGKTVK
jgi:hypothetical protein